jgi:hypothetical protein
MAFPATGKLAAALALCLTVACKTPESGVSGDSAAALAYLPRDSAIALGVSWQALRTSPLYSAIESRARREMSAQLARMQEVCDIDLLGIVQTAVIATDRELKNHAAVLKGELSRTALTACLDKLGIPPEGPLQIADLSIRWHSPADNTLVLSSFEDGAAIKARIGEQSLRDNKELMQAIGQVQPSATLWLAGELDAAPFAALDGLGGRSGYFSAVLTPGASAAAGVVFDSADDAETALSLVDFAIARARKEAGPFKDIVQQVKVARSGATIRLQVALTTQQLSSLSELGKSLFL